MRSRHTDWVPPSSFDEYRLVQALGGGTLGQLWLAHDTVLDRLVAVKLIAEFPAPDAVRQRLLIEARAAARVQHPNIVAVYRVGQIGSRPYLISEYVRGDSLDRLARPVAWPRLLPIAIGLARGLAAAHRQGVSHGDLAPASAIVAETGEVKLRNFGLATLLPHVASPYADASPDHAAVPPSDRNAQTVEVTADAPVAGDLRLPAGTSPEVPRVRESAAELARAKEVGDSDPGAGAGTGTPAYMSPEAWRGEPATPRSDVYSLGALLYALGAGDPPHRGAAPPLASAALAIDPGFAAVVDRCLRRDPADRFASGDAVRAALEALAAGDQTAARVRGRPPWERLPPRLRRAVLLGAALALCGGLARLAYSALGGAPSPPPVASGRCPGGMVPVPAGTFRMGSPEGTGDTDEQPQHEVTLSAYCIDRTEVTVAAYAACVAAGGCREGQRTVNVSEVSAAAMKRIGRKCNRQDRPDHPINCVDWDQAASYCTWSGKRLPTEAEWEYAARGNDGRVYPWGAETPTAKRMKLCGNECLGFMESRYDDDNGWRPTSPVGSYPEGASPFGALDLAGDVREWTADWYGPYPRLAETNPQGPSTGTSRVSRGGGGVSRDSNNKARAADRDWPDPTIRYIDLGFRCARGN